jgi:hypothetical protein
VNAVLGRSSSALVGFHLWWVAMYIMGVSHLVYEVVHAWHGVGISLRNNVPFSAIHTKMK